MAIQEIAPDLYRISMYIPDINLQFNQFLVRDDQPLLFHTGMRGIFPLVQDDVARLIDPAKLRWIAFSHFESDECGALNEWLELAPKAEPVCSFVGAMVSVNDFASRPARPMSDGETLSTGKHRFRFLQTPHVPHCWEAGLMFEEVHGTLLCSDLFTHQGNVGPQTTADVVGRFKEGLIRDQEGPFADAYPYTTQTDKTLKRLAALNPKTLAIMHGSTFLGDGKQALKDLATAMQELLAGESSGNQN